MKSHPVEILLVDDNVGDIVLTTEALKSSKFCNRVSTVNDGVEAMEFLRREGRFKRAPFPDLVLLDINMPRKNGHEVLAEMRSDKQLSWIPVVMLTSSDSVEDINKAYALHANCYVTKPSDYDRMQQAVLAIDSFWNSVAKLPRRH